MKSAGTETFRSIRAYVRKRPDQYENLEDFLDTLLEEADPEFQSSLKRAAKEIRHGRFLSRTELKLALANKKLR